MPWREFSRSSTVRALPLRFPDTALTWDTHRCQGVQRLSRNANRRDHRRRIPQLRSSPREDQQDWQESQLRRSRWCAPVCGVDSIESTTEGREEIEEEETTRGDLGQSREGHAMDPDCWRRGWRSGRCLIETREGQWGED